MNTIRYLRRSGALAPLVLVGGLVACSGDDAEDADSSGPPADTVTVTDTVTPSSPPATGGTGGSAGDGTGGDTGAGTTGDPDLPEGSGPLPPSTGPPEDTLPAPGTQLDITEVRAGSHTGYDRLAVEFTGTGTPGSAVRLTTDPRADGSGFPVEYTGAQALTVMVHGMTYNDVTAALSGVPAGVIASVEVMGAFEGDQLIVVGLTDGTVTLDDISVLPLTDPTRLVIDITR